VRLEHLAAVLQPPAGASSSDAVTQGVRGPGAAAAGAAGAVGPPRLVAAPAGGATPAGAPAAAPAPPSNSTAGNATRAAMAVSVVRCERHAQRVPAITKSARALRSRVVCSVSGCAHTTHACLLRLPSCPTLPLKPPHSSHTHTHTHIQSTGDCDDR
jgi:hypothetical protein